MIALRALLPRNCRSKILVGLISNTHQFCFRKTKFSTGKTFFMNPQLESQALSSGERVKELATKLIYLSGTVHDALRRLSSDNATNVLLTPYALLTEEYALRFRANILLTDAERFVIPDFETPHGELMTSLSAIETKLGTVTQLEELSELLSGLTLFSNSIISRKKHIISLLFKNLIGTMNSEF